MDAEERSVAGCSRPSLRCGKRMRSKARNDAGYLRALCRRWPIPGCSGQHCCLSVIVVGVRRRFLGPGTAVVRRVARATRRGRPCRIRRLRPAAAAGGRGEVKPSGICQTSPGATPSPFFLWPRERCEMAAIILFDRQPRLSRPPPVSGVMWERMGPPESLSQMISFSRFGQLHGGGVR